MAVIQALISFWNKLVAIITQLFQLLGYNQDDDEEAV